MSSKAKHKDNVGPEYISATYGNVCYVSAEVCPYDAKVTLPFMCDTGATTSAIGEDLYRSKLSHISLKDRKVVVKGFSGGQVV